LRCAGAKQRNRTKRDRKFHSSLPTQARLRLERA
jgi:hypothetical protein